MQAACVIFQGLQWQGPVDVLVSAATILKLLAIALIFLNFVLGPWN